MSSSKNLDFEKTSFLNKSNSAFIEEMYLKFVNKDADLPESWANYFDGIGEELNVIAKEINGPSWGPIKKMEECGITVAKSPSIIGKTLFDKLSNWKKILEGYIK